MICSHGIPSHILCLFQLSDFGNEHELLTRHQQGIYQHVSFLTNHIQQTFQKEEGKHSKQKNKYLEFTATITKERKNDFNGHNPALYYQHVFTKMRNAKLSSNL